MSSRTTVRIDRHYREEDAHEALAADVRAGLTATPKTLPPKWLYDDAGSDLFEQITRLEEYYPTRREREILVAHAADVAAATGASTLVELGSGSSEKTRLLLDALDGAGTLERYVPVDVSDSTLIAAAEALIEDYPGLDVHAVVADFEAHLELLPADPSRLVVFLGGTIGNFEPAPRARFLQAVAETLRPGDAFLLGTDLVKDAGRLVRAYDDAAGVTAAFDRNVLYVVNRELGGDFDPEAFEHLAVWDADEEWIEMRLRSLREQTVHVKALDLEVAFAEGEQMRTEVSAKFTRERVERELAAAGLRPAAWWTDRAGDFALSLALPA
jgi:L-histidine N-alpha-methyltransferase